MGSLKREVIAYCAGIIAMSFFALSRVTLWSGPAFWLPFGGSLLFILSDSVLAVNHFGQPVKHYCPKVIVPYAMALMLIVVGVSF